MKISELIALAEQHIREHGDQEVLVEHYVGEHGWGFYTEDGVLGVVSRETTDADLVLRI